MGGCPLVLAPPGDPALGKIVRAHFQLDRIAGHDADIVHPQLAGNVRRDDVPVGKRDFKGRVGQRLHYFTLCFDHIVFGHEFSLRCFSSAACFNAARMLLFSSFPCPIRSAISGWNRGRRRRCLAFFFFGCCAGCAAPSASRTRPPSVPTIRYSLPRSCPARLSATPPASGVCTFMQDLLNRKDLDAVLADDDRVFVMCRALSVRHARRPAVFVDGDLPRARGDHRFDADDGTGAEPHARSALPVIGDGRVLVHLPADAVPDVFAHDRKAVRFRMRLHRCADVVQRRACTQVFDRLPEALLGDAHELLLFLADGADRKSARPVAVEPVFIGAQIDADDVALFENDVLRGDAVHDDLVDGGADACGVAAIAEAGRFGAARTDVLARDPVQLGGRDPRPHRGTHRRERIAHDRAGLAHEVDLTLRFDKDHRLASLPAAYFLSAAQILANTSSMAPTPSMLSRTPFLV